MKDLLGKSITVNGVPLPDRKNLRIIAEGATAIDNEAERATEITFPAPGDGGGEGGGAESFAATLGAGNTSGGIDVQMTEGSSITLDGGSVRVTGGGDLVAASTGGVRLNGPGTTPYIGTSGETDPSFSLLINSNASLYEAHIVGSTETVAPEGSRSVQVVRQIAAVTEVEYYVIVSDGFPLVAKYLVFSMEDGSNFNIARMVPVLPSSEWSGITQFDVELVGEPGTDGYELVVTNTSGGNQDITIYQRVLSCRAFPV